MSFPSRFVGKWPKTIFFSPNEIGISSSGARRSPCLRHPAPAAPVELVGTVGKEEPAPAAEPLAAWAGEPSFLAQGELTNRNGAHGGEIHGSAS